MPKLIPIDFNQSADFKLWQKYIRQRRDTHSTDQPEWRLLFRELYGIPNYTWVYLDGATLKGGFSLYHIRSPLMGNLLVTCPFFGNGGFSADTDIIRDLLLTKIDFLAHRLNVDYVELRLSGQLPLPYNYHSDFNEFNLTLGTTADSTWKELLTSNVRQNIRKAQRNGLVFSLTRDYRPVFRLLSETLRDHGTPFHGERFFQLLIKYFNENVLFSQVHHNKRLVAGGIVLRFDDRIITPYIGSLKNYRWFGSNYCQYWGIIKYCHEQGIRHFDMGRSPSNSTHDSFKQKWGATALPAYYNHMVINPDKKYRSVSQPSNYQLWATEVWKRLPLLATRLAGSYLFRHIP